LFEKMITTILIASLVIGLMASLTVNGYLFGKINAARPVEPVKEPVKTEASRTYRLPKHSSHARNQYEHRTGSAICSSRPSHCQPVRSNCEGSAQKDGLVPTQQQPKVPAAVQEKFLEDAGAVVASSAT
jgi:hypothetical protein